MTTHLNENLENLRLRATCSICTELYTKPKQLPNCSHVFCLSCVRRYLQSKLPNNFPPCPMCRKPITRALKDVDNLEPARAEEDIIEFVRPFENCDLCKKRERPTLKCIECSGLVCENCEPVHGSLQPTHTVASIFESGVVIKGKSTENECKVHPNQALDLYCLMCNTILCMYCDKYSHALCASSYEDIHIYKQKIERSSELLQEFVVSNEERKALKNELDNSERLMMTERAQRNHFQFLTSVGVQQMQLPHFMNPAMAQLKALPSVTSSAARSYTSVHTHPALRVVQLSEFATFARKYLHKLTAEIEMDVEFYKVYIERVNKISEDQEDKDTADPEFIIQRKRRLKDEIDPLVEKGETLISDSRILIDKPSDVDIAESVLNCEQSCLQFFRFRKPYSLDACCIGLKVDNLNQQKTILRQMSSCTLQEHVGKAVGLFIDRLEVDAETITGKVSANENPDTGDNSVKVTGEEVDAEDSMPTMTEENKVVLNTIKCFCLEKNRKSFMVDNCLYINRFLESLKYRTGLSIDKSSISGTGFTGTDLLRAMENKCLDKLKYNNSSSCIEIRKSFGPEVLKYYTHFGNLLFAAPFIHENDRISRLTNKAVIPSILCLIGTHKSGSGLESLFLVASENQQELSNGLSVCAKVARFKQTDFSGDMGTTVSLIGFYNDEHFTYSFLRAASYHERSLITYHTDTGDSNEQNDFYCLSNDGSRKELPINVIKVELLCEIKEGVFYVKREDDKLVVGRLTMNQEINTNIIFSLTQEDVEVAIGKIRPLTMAETRQGNLVVACAVVDDISKLVMILPGAQKVELLEIQYQAADYCETTMADLEMDSDGNIMCILKGDEGKLWRLVTKYIMP